LPVSIVIPTYNRSELLAKIIPTYTAQSCAEIIIVDDCSEPSVAEVFAEAGLSEAATIIRNTRHEGSPASRTTAIRSCTQPFIFFGEDDLYLPAGYIANLFDYISRGTADIVASRVKETDSLNDDPTRPTRRASSGYEIARIGWDFLVRGDRSVRQPVYVPHLHTWALAPKHVIEEIGFDRRFKGNAFREETDVYLSAFERGYRLAFVPGKLAFHYKGPLNISGGQYKSSIAAGLAWYEYHVFLNNLRFLRKHRHALGGECILISPFIDSALYSIRRALGYPGRISAQLRRHRATA